MRRRHGGAVVAGISAVGNSRGDGRAGGTKVHGRGAIVRKRGQVTGRGDGSHRHQAVPIAGTRHALVVRRIVRGRFVVGGGVASRRDEQDAGIAATIDGVEQRLAEATTTPGVVGGYQVDAMPQFQVRQVVQRTHRIGGGATRGPQELGGDDGDVPVDAHHALAVVALATDGAGHMGAVRIVQTVIDRGVVVHEVPAVDVVDEAVAVIVDACPTVLLWQVHPDVVTQVRVVHLDTFVDDAHYHLLRTDEAFGPHFGGLATKGIRRRRSVAEHAPQRAVGVAGVVRAQHRVDVVVRVRVANVRVTQQLLDDRIDIRARLELQLLGVAVRTRQGLRGKRTHRCPRRGPRERRSAGAVAHQHHAIHVGGRGHYRRRRYQPDSNSADESATNSPRKTRHRHGPSPRPAGVGCLWVPARGRRMPQEITKCELPNIM